MSLYIFKLIKIMIIGTLCKARSWQCQMEFTGYVTLCNIRLITLSKPTSSLLHSVFCRIHHRIKSYHSDVFELRIEWAQLYHQLPSLDLEADLYWGRELMCFYKLKNDSEGSNYIRFILMIRHFDTIMPNFLWSSPAVTTPTHISCHCSCKRCMTRKWRGAVV